MKTKMPPECALHGPMEQRPVERQTKEQQWCGEWWDCSKCGSSYLQPSLDLEKQLAVQRLELFDNDDVKWKLTDRERGWYDVIVGRFKIAQASWRRIAFLCGLCGTWLVLGTLPSALWAWLV